MAKCIVPSSVKSVSCAVISTVMVLAAVSDLKAVFVINPRSRITKSRLVEPSSWRRSIDGLVFKRQFLKLIDGGIFQGKYFYRRDA